MHTTRKVCIAAAAVTGLLAGPAAAQSVEWKDDGTVLLHLGEAYNDAVIQTTREELGSEFGPDKKPFEGVTIRIMPNGKVAVATGATTHGQGTRTTLSQIVADHLDVLQHLFEVAGDRNLFDRKSELAVFDP